LVLRYVSDVLLSYLNGDVWWQPVLNTVITRSCTCRSDRPTRLLEVTYFILCHFRSHFFKHPACMVFCWRGYSRRERDLANWWCVLQLV